MVTIQGSVTLHVLYLKYKLLSRLNCENFIKMKITVKLNLIKSFISSQGNKKSTPKSRETNPSNKGYCLDGPFTV
jgi:hypothetical protein